MADGMAIGPVEDVLTKGKKQIPTSEGFDFNAYLQKTPLFEAAQLWQKPQETTGAAAMYG